MRERKSREKNVHGSPSGYVRYLVRERLTLRDIPPSYSLASLFSSQRKPASRDDDLPRCNEY